MRIRLGIPLSLGEITAAIGGIPYNVDQHITVSHLSTDSREIVSGDLFIALRGDNFNGSDFVLDAAKKGAQIISERRHNGGIYVPNGNVALLKLSEYYKSLLPRLKHTVAISGSVGKTTTKDFIARLLSSHFSTHATLLNLNNRIGMPLTVLSADANCEALVLEMGMNHRGEIAELSRYAAPTLAVITNIGTAHIGILGSRNAIAEAKCEIYEGMTGGYVICQKEEPLLRKLQNRLTVSNTDPEADFFAKPKPELSCGSGFDLYSKFGTITNLSLSVIGEHMQSAAAYAAAVALLCGVPHEKIKRALRSIHECDLRRQLYPLGDYTVLDDSYNASFESFEANFKMLRYYPFQHFSALIGDIQELGDMSEHIHRQVGHLAARNKLERLYLYGRYSEYVRRGALEGGFSDENIYLNDDLATPHITAMQIAKYHISGELILFKASHKTNLGKIIELLKSMEKNNNAG